MLDLPIGILFDSKVADLPDFGLVHLGMQSLTLEQERTDWNVNHPLIDAGSPAFLHLPVPLKQLATHAWIATLPALSVPLLSLLRARWHY